MTNATIPLTERQLKALATRIDRPIVLVGMMGVGKSTIGRKLAQVLHLPFTDADDAIELAAQMKITEIFERYGEAHFRDGERRVITRLMDGGPAVIATGGGAFVQDETRELIQAKGISVWLDCDAETLVERVTRKDTRPLLRGSDPGEIVRRLKADREPFYSLSAIHVMSDAGPHGETVNRILQGINQWL